MKTLDELGISPAPWNASAVFPAVISINGEEVCDLSDNENAESDAFLIAAAPNLYEVACRLLVVAKNRMPSQPTIEELQTLVDAECALAKAGGESEVAK